jgi:hypothetical protein
LSESYSFIWQPKVLMKTFLAMAGSLAIRKKKGGAPQRAANIQGPRRDTGRG